MSQSSTPILKYFPSTSVILSSTQSYHNESRTCGTLTHRDIVHTRT
jgi:hypothetical protein